MRTLERAHPLVCFAWLGFVLGITIFTRNPLLLSESLFFAVIACALSGRLNAVIFLPAAVIALINPLFSARGATALFFIGDSAYTLEGLAYGAAFALLLCAALLWSGVSARFIPSDKFLWLFGSILPSAALTLSCALRFVPLFIRRTALFTAARHDGSLKGRLKAFSAALGYSAEEAIACADSMRSRGYGTGRRSFFSLYRLTAKNALALSAVVVLGGGSAALAVMGAGEFFYYPALSALPTTPADIALYGAFGALCALPAAAIIAEELRRKTASRGNSLNGGNKCTFP